MLPGGFIRFSYTVSKSPHPAASRPPHTRSHLAAHSTVIVRARMGTPHWCAEPALSFSLQGSRPKPTSPTDPDPPFVSPALRLLRGPYARHSGVTKTGGGGCATQTLQLDGLVKGAGEDSVGAFSSTTLSVSFPGR